MREQVVILSHLLDKFEKSRHLFEPGVSNRRVVLRIEKKELPEYQFEAADVRDAFNQAAILLQQQNLMDIHWVSGRPVMSEVVLNLQQVDAVYDLCGRIHPKRLAEQVSDMVKGRLSGVHTDWIQAWRDSICQAALEKYTVPTFCKGDLSPLRDLLTAFEQYDALTGNAISMRAFSNRCYHDTKYFERNVRAEFLRIAAKYCLNFPDSSDVSDLSQRDQLSFLGIYARPELYELSGNLQIFTEVGQINCSPATPFGIAIPSPLVDCITGFCLDAIARVTFIENKTNYDEYLVTEKHADELVLYQGGFLSPQQRKLYTKLAKSLAPDISAYFWADIDLGGFRMFQQLQAIVPTLQPMRMSVPDILQHKDTGLPRADQYWERLQSALNTQEFPLFSEQIQTLLKYRVTIEQEAFL